MGWNTKYFVLLTRLELEPEAAGVVYKRTDKL